MDDSLLEMMYEMRTECDYMGFPFGDEDYDNEEFEEEEDDDQYDGRGPNGVARVTCPDCGCEFWPNRFADEVSCPDCGAEVDSE